MISDIIQIAFYILTCVLLIKTLKRSEQSTKRILELEDENIKIRKNYNDALKDLMDSYHMIIAAKDGHVSQEEIQNFINKPKKK